MDDERVIESSGNVYADFGFPDADEMLIKARLALQINTIIESRALNQRQAAIVLGIDQPKVSLLSRGRLRGFSMERLMELLNRLDQDVEIMVHPKRLEHARIAVYEQEAEYDSERARKPSID
ncbi:hypothetical protein BH09CHL1_BH09CHL1_34190 [soil metagenome]